MRNPFHIAEPHRQNRLRTLECLTLSFLIDAGNHRMFGRIETEPGDVDNLVYKEGVGRKLGGSAGGVASSRTLPVCCYSKLSTAARSIDSPLWYRWK